MSLKQAIRAAPPTEHVALHNRHRTSGVRSYPWIEHPDESIRIAIDHSAPDQTVTSIRVIGGVMKRPMVEELRMYWPEPDEVNETKHVQQYVWYDLNCGVRARVTLVEDKILISLVTIPESSGSREERTP